MHIEFPDFHVNQLLAKTANHSVSGWQGSVQREGYRYLVSEVYQGGMNDRQFLTSVPRIAVEQATWRTHR